MENLRILAENIDQKNEIISMLVSIGYNRESTCSYDDEDLMGIHVYEDGDIQDVLMGDYCDKDHKEITIQQLRDMVVLKRNSINDATHINFRTNTSFLVQGFKEYFYLNNKWILSDSVNDLKPIEKKEMKEFLVNHDGKWTLQLLDSDTEENIHRVAVPSGAEVLKVFHGADSGLCFYKENYTEIWQDLVEKPYWGNIGENNSVKNRGEILWQRSETEYLMQGENGDKLMESIAELKSININSVNDGFTGIANAADKLSKNIRTKLGFSFNPVDDESQDTVKVTIDELKHRVYKKDVSHLDSIDVYRVLELFNVQSHAVGHAIKKLLCSGGRGAKDEAQDIQEAIDSLIRYQEMKNEDK